MTDKHTEIQARLEPMSIASSESELLEVGDMIASIKRRARELEDEWKAKMIAWIKSNGELVINSPDGPIHYRVAPVRTTTSRDNYDTLEALLDASGGDLKRLQSCLSAQPFRHGACRTLLGDENYERCFETTTGTRLDRGKPTKKQTEELQRVNERFLPRRP